MVADTLSTNTTPSISDRDQAAEALLSAIEAAAEEDRQQGGDGFMAYPLDSRLSERNYHLHGTGRGYRLAIETWYTRPGWSHQLYGDDIDGFIPLDRREVVALIAGDDILPQLRDRHAVHQEKAKALIARAFTPHKSVQL
jgi:hypothetical protein